jgi:hypothetical protein
MKSKLLDSSSLPRSYFRVSFGPVFLRDKPNFALLYSVMAG